MRNVKKHSCDLRFNITDMLLSSANTPYDDNWVIQKYSVHFYLSLGVHAENEMAAVATNIVKQTEWFADAAIIRIPSRVNPHDNAILIGQAPI